MKFIHKERILQILGTLYRANSYFCNLGNLEKLTELCAVCQETALGIGNNIESTEENPETVISHLEEYCELIYQLSLMYGKRSMMKGQIRKIENILRLIKSDINEGFECQVSEVVFLPYKASMWDCFQSIYDACKKDSRFQAYVVPIPYYNFDKNRNIVSESYEGEVIAQFVEITDYRTFNLADRKPDIIFIHNPYDAYNRVTQLKETYFSSELVKYTDHLVYIPYYVSKKYTKDSMTVLPGVKNSWKTIVQSEDLKQQYIKNGIRQEQVEALGSPKFDMVLKAQKEYTGVPTEWSVLSGKKVYFYNTHLDGLMNHVDLFLDKVQGIIECIGRHPNTALLWRPHPLSLETLQTFHPEAYSRYVELIEKFKRDGNGVYDDTPSLERTIAVSDAYIGEEQSSVSQLYEITGKPMYYIEYDSFKIFQKERQARCLCAEKYGDKIYMYSWEYNCIFIYDEENRTISCRKGNTKLGAYERVTYTRSALYKEFIYFIPSYAGSVIKFNTLTEELQYIGMGTDKAEYTNMETLGKEFHPVIYQGILYMMPIYYSSKIPCLVLDEDKIVLIDSCYEQQIGTLGNGGDLPIFYGNTLVEDCIWRVCRLGPYMQKYDISNQRFEYIQINGIEEKAVRAAVFDGKYFWMLMQEGNRLLQWDCVTNKILEEITITEVPCNPGEACFAGIYYYNGSLWILPLKGAKIVRVDVLSKEKTIIDCNNIEGFCLDSEYRQTFARNCVVEKNLLYLFPCTGNGIVKINMNNNQTIFLSTQLPKDGILDKIGADTIYNEGMCSLEDFLKYSQMHDTTRQDKSTELAGEKIWDYITDNL